MKLAYRVYGEGTPLIILHGLFGQSDNWNSLAKQFADTGHRVFTVDQRNHGLSPHSHEWDYELMAKDVKELIEDEQLSEPVLLGHSMGGKTVLFFEWLFPGTAQRLIIADIAPRAYPPHHNEVLAALNSVDFTSVKTRKDAESKLGEYISDFGTKQFLLKNIYWKDATANVMDWRFNLSVITDNYNNISEPVPFFQSKTPCLVIRGGNSPYVTDDDVKDLQNRFASLTAVTIPEAGHWVHAERPKEFFEAVKGFLQ